MRLFLPTGLLFLVVMAVIGCGTPAPESEEGAWLGEGVFSARAGTQDVKAQLELLSDGTYRFLILEPKILMMGGVEKGTWSREGNEISLDPGSAQTGGGGILSSAPKEFRPKTLTVASDYSSISLEDGKMTIDFEYNPEATKKLRESGEVD